ncbi:MAG: hypothetical protein ACRDP8_18115 [Actinopolymorphaceae bacterium]
MDATTPDRPAVLDDALADFTGMLARDGYAAEWDLDADGRLHFRILATDDACADCLVPEVVLEAMLTEALDGTGYELGEVRLPA